MRTIEYKNGAQMNTILVNEQSIHRRNAARRVYLDRINGQVITLIDEPMENPAED